MNWCPEHGELTFERHDRRSAQKARETVALIYGDAYADRIDSGDPFYGGDAFMRRFDAYTSRDGFDLVIASQDGEPVGQAWGWPLDEVRGAAWWNGIAEEPEPGFTDEDGRRTFAFSEIMVRRAWAGRGIAHMLHDRLLLPRRESRAVLLVRPMNSAAYHAYLRWGWHKVAQLRPNVPHAPLFDVLMLPLPIVR